ncbi:MAG: hypothetical protein K2P94_06735 [Rhodospirillaceae bacterium]|nr:hypothetical protein [Rhodospirillaceae bacterium]
MTRAAAGISAVMVLVCVGALTLAVSTMPISVERGPHSVALVALFTSPEKFDGAIVTVAGFLIAEEGESALYLSEDDAMARTDNKFALTLDKFARADLDQADRLYVRVTGTFQRHSSMGKITEVTRIVPAIRGPGGRLRYDEAPEISPQGVH